MKNIRTIMQKEFFRFFKDKRLVIFTLFFPGIMIYVLYSFMGSAMSNAFSEGEGYVGYVYVKHMPETLEPYFSVPQNIKVLNVEPADDDAEYKELVKNKNIDLYIVFPENFDDAVKDYDVTKTPTESAPNIKVYFNTANSNSNGTYNTVLGLLTAYEGTLSNKFDINSSKSFEEAKEFDLAVEEDVSGQVFSMMLPMLILTFIFSGCMAVAPESIAGEKERGTIATLLVTPIDRSQLAIGKIISLSTIALLSGISSFTGTILSLPKLMGSEVSLSVDMYKVSDYLMLLGVILSSIVVLITLISILSTFAKTVKEATTLITPFLIVVMLIGVSSMFGSNTDKTFMYLIPLYNSVQSMSAIFSIKIDMINLVITIVSNVAYAGVLVFVLSKMFKNEKIMFSK